MASRYVHYDKTTMKVVAVSSPMPSMSAKVQGMKVIEDDSKMVKGIGDTITI